MGRWQALQKANLGSNPHLSHHVTHSQIGVTKITPMCLEAYLKFNDGSKCLMLRL